MKLILFFAIYFHLPILSNPDWFLNRHNDLTEFFWSNFLTIKKSLLINNSLPFWQPYFLSGTPLWQDPQSMILQPFHFIFLILDIKIAFLILIIFYSFLAGWGMYRFAKSFKLTEEASLFVSIIYIGFPLYVSYLEAGHYGLMAAWGFLPWLLDGQKIFISMVWGSLLIMSHTIFGFVSLIFLTIIRPKLGIITSILSMCLLGVVLVPFLDWQESTNRQYLLSMPQTYPVWAGKSEFVKVFANPLLFGKDFVQTLSTEKFVSTGFLVLILSALGFLSLKRNLKIKVSIVLILIFVIGMNNISPIFEILIEIPLYRLMRVGTRIWFVAAFVLIILAGIGIDSIKNIRLKRLLIVSAILEVHVLSWIYLAKPTNIPQLVSNKIINVIKNDNGLFRVYCEGHCISQKFAVENDIYLTSGYSTLIQNNYYQHGWQLFGDYWNYYSLAVPPYGFKKLSFNLESLGEYNTKYVIVDRKIENANLAFVLGDEPYYLYENKLFKPRVVGGKILDYKAGRIAVRKNKDNLENEIILSEVYSKGWTAEDDNGKIYKSNETPSRLQMFIVEDSSDNLVLKYTPSKIVFGFFVSFFSFFISLGFFLFHIFKKK